MVISLTLTMEDLVFLVSLIWLYNSATHKR
jgi:hypothetical protein